MSLEKWVEYSWLRREPTSPLEIKDLLGIVDRSLADSKVDAVSTDLRFIAAFNAALAVALTALRASGHRTVTQAGHHVKTIESLELTVKASPKVIQRFKTFNNKRNKSVYDIAGAVSDQSTSSGSLHLSTRERAECREPNPHIRAGRGMFLTCPLIDQGITRFD
jgi:hypothetical protein